MNSTTKPSAKWRTDSVIAMHDNREVFIVQGFGGHAGDRLEADGRMATVIGTMDWPDDGSERKEIGPLSPEDVQTLIDRGTIDPSILV